MQEKMSYYQIKQKEQTAKENLVFQFSKILSWFLHTVAMLISAMLKALVNAIKMLMHTD